MKFNNIEQFCEGLRACGSNEDRHQLLEDTMAEEGVVEQLCPTVDAVCMLLVNLPLIPKLLLIAYIEQREDYLKQLSVTLCDLSWLNVNMSNIDEFFKYPGQLLSHFSSTYGKYQCHKTKHEMKCHMLVVLPLLKFRCIDPMLMKHILTFSVRSEAGRNVFDLYDEARFDFFAKLEDRSSTRASATTVGKEACHSAV